MMNYCSKCVKSTMYYTKKGNLCSTCKNVLNYKCGKCMKLFDKKFPLQWHLSNLCNREKNLYCDHCNYKTGAKLSLVVHIQAKHLPRDPNLYKCKKCEKNFSQASNLTRHLKICGLSKISKSWLKNLSCDYCNLKYSNKTSLTTHIQTKHFPVDPYKNMCNKCRKNFSSRSKLQRHSITCGIDLKTLSKLKRFFCDHCNYNVLEKYKLVPHMQAKHLPQHLNINKCDKCGRNFSYHSNLARHSKICGKSEDLKRSLKRFCCDYCNYKVLEKSSLLRHIKLHLSEDPNGYKCQKCERIFSKRQYCTMHSKVCGLSQEERKSVRKYVRHIKT